MTLQLTRRRFTVADYYRMAEAGILTQDERVELIEGEIVEMTPIGSRHAACVDEANRLLGQIAGDAARVRVQNPVRFGEHNEPEPDVALVRPRPDRYASAHPTPADVLLVVEVADTTIDLDRRVKMPLYGRSGIPESWLVDLNSELIEAHPTRFCCAALSPLQDTPLLFLHQQGIIWGMSARTQEMTPRHDTSTPVEALRTLK